VSRSDRSARRLPSTSRASLPGGGSAAVTAGRADPRAPGQQRTECHSRLGLLAEQSTRLIELFKTRKRIRRSILDQFERLKERSDGLRAEVEERDSPIGKLERGAPDLPELQALLGPFAKGMAALARRGPEGGAPSGHRRDHR